tara:strand:- start:1058 stop:1159 length:102 start_codon:yes stop_codon:yes gene_type:complete
MIGRFEYGDYNADGKVYEKKKYRYYLNILTATR